MNNFVRTILILKQALKCLEIEKRKGNKGNVLNRDINSAYIFLEKLENNSKVFQKCTDK